MRRTQTTMPSEAVLNIPVTLRVANERTGLTYVYDDGNGLPIEASVYATSIGNAKNKLRPLIEAELRDALVQMREYRQALIGCVDGTLLLIQFRYGQWGYTFGGPERKHFSGGVSGFGCGVEGTRNDFHAAIAAAKQHAEVFGGVAWENLG